MLSKPKSLTKIVLTDPLQQFHGDQQSSTHLTVDILWVFLNHLTLKPLHAFYILLFVTIVIRCKFKRVIEVNLRSSHVEIYTVQRRRKVSLMCVSGGGGRNENIRPADRWPLAGFGILWSGTILARNVPRNFWPEWLPDCREWHFPDLVSAFKHSLFWDFMLAMWNTLPKEK